MRLVWDEMICVTVRQYSLLSCRRVSCSEQPPPEICSQTEHEGKARSGLGEDSMTVWQDVLSYTLSVPTRAQTAHQGHTWAKRGGRKLQDLLLCVRVCLCLCACLMQEEIYCPGETLVHIQDANSSGSIINKMYLSQTHTHIRTNAYRLLLSHLRKTLQMCLGNWSTRELFFPFLSQTNSNTLSILTPREDSFSVAAGSA